jgi:hypothetical protein
MFLGDNRWQTKRLIYRTEEDMMDWLESPTIFIAAILALPVLWFAKRSLADEDDRVGVLGVWFVMAVIVLYLLWYGGAWGVAKFMDTGSQG